MIMMRRGSGRAPPPYILVGLVLVIAILGFNYWTLSTQHADLQQEVEKLQSEVKISAMKQEQSEKKNSALQETVHEMDELSNRLNKKIQSDDDALRSSDQENQKLKYEITSLKNKAAKMQEQINSLNQEAEDRELDLSKAKETNSHLASERDDAIDAIAEKDAMINALKRQLEQAQDELAALRREKLAVAKPKVVPGLMNIQGIENKEPFLGPGQLDYISRGAVNTHDKGMQGINFHREIPILPRVNPNAARKKPRFSVADIAREVVAGPQLHPEPQMHPGPHILPGPAYNPAGNGMEGAGVLAAPQPIEQEVVPVNNAGHQLMPPAGN
ncbi:hypothetical protein SK128_006089 [Halocaridina rubra]|uniref:Uncharacterized protein n=1 Tax=Halocaridina rubra TaxID=373956 RepID=A0AAN8WKB8_HALRR